MNILLWVLAIILAGWIILREIGFLTEREGFRSTKCFSCEKQMPWVGHGTKCFSCEKETPWLAYGNKCFSCERRRARST